MRHIEWDFLREINFTKIDKKVEQVVFEKSAICFRAGPTQSQNSAWPGRLGAKIPPGRADSQKTSMT